MRQLGPPVSGLQFRFDQLGEETAISRARRVAGGDGGRIGRQQIAMPARNSTKAFGLAVKGLIPLAGMFRRWVGSLVE